MSNQIKKNLISNEIVTSAMLIKVLTLRFFSQNNFDITPEQFVILDTISKNNGLYQRQIGELISKDRANVARILNILLEKKLIKKTQDSNGRLINRILITSLGEELIKKISPKIKQLRKIYLSNVDDDELEVCYKILNKIKNSISESTKLNI